jgi:hypothetical protein
VAQAPVGDLAQEEGAEIVDCCHFVRWHLLDSVDGIGEVPCGLHDTISSCYDWDWDCMVLIAERVRDTFASCVLHDDPNSTGVGGGMGELPCFGGMTAPRFALAGFLANQDLCEQNNLEN